MKNSLKRLWVVLLAIMVFSCSEVTEQQSHDIQAQYAENFVSLEEISLIAKDLNFDKKTISNKTVASTEKTIATKTKTIESIEKVADENGNVVYYIVNYKEKGFTILAADNRAVPVLAFSDNGKFVLNKNTMPEGLTDWVADRKAYIESIRKNNNTQPIATALLKIITDPDGGYIPPNTGCKPLYKEVGPLLKTTWGQGEGYNNLTPLTGCFQYANGHAPTGCVATAMAQVMKYHQHPKTYNWTLMPINIGSGETQKLMRDVGKSIKMQYTCGGSGAYMKDVSPALMNTFKYTSAKFSSFNEYVAKDELSVGRPVIFAGYNSTSAGHAWVADGFKTYGTCTTNSSGNYDYKEYTYFNMNWGWGSSYVGYYYSSSWSPYSGMQFNDNRQMIYNIKP